MPDYEDAVRLPEDEVGQLFDESLEALVEQLDAIDTVQDAREAGRLEKTAVAFLASLLQLATALRYINGEDIDKRVDDVLAQTGRRKGSLKLEPAFALLYGDSGIPPANLALEDALVAARSALPGLIAAER